MGPKARRRVSTAIVVGVVGGLVPLVALTLSPSAADAVPAGFTEQTVVNGLDQPMAVEFSEDGRVFVAEKSGLIKVFDGLGDTSPTTFADLRTQVYNQVDRGLMSLALAPTFPADPSVYVLYAHDAAIGGTAPLWGTPGATDDVCPNGDECLISGRLSKLNASLAGGGPEQVLVEDWCQQYPSHSVGDLAFGPDGYLYASGGDGASFSFADYGQVGNVCGDPPVGVGQAQTVPSAEGGALRSQDVQTLGDPMGLDGSVIRIDPVTGEGAPGNPMITSEDPNARRLIGTGLRNPFRFAFRPGTSELWLGDVGWTRWEEINRIGNPTDGTVDNFGWPCREGNDAGYDFGLTLCDQILGGAVPTVPPHFTYNHGAPVITGDGCGGGGSSTSGVAFYQGGQYPAEYDGALFFADYSRQCIWVMFPGADGVPDPATRTVFRESGAFPVDLKIGPNGDLYYVDIAVGEVRRIRHASGNQPPIAAITADPTGGALPLTVSFSATGSTDPEGAALTYAWDLDGDGAFDDATGATATRTYDVAGAYDAAVRVSDPSSQTDVATRRILAGTTAPTATIDTPSESLTWVVGDTISFSGSANDPEDGPLPASALAWKVILHHCNTIDSCHEHQLAAFNGVASGTFSAPDHEYPSYLEVRLTATDGTGVATTASRRLDPQVSTLTIETSPPGLSATLSGTTAATPYTAQGIVGSRLTLSTPATQTIGTNTYEFTGWSDNGARVHDVIVAATDTTYRATFTRTSGADPALIAAYNFDDGAGSTLTDRTGHGHQGTVTGATWSTAGHTGGALSFDGVDDLVTIADAADLDLTSGLTLQAWVRPTAGGGWRTTIMKERPAGLSYTLYSAGFNDPSGYLNTGPDIDVTGPAPLATDTWTHLALSYDGTTMRLYANGTEIAAKAHTGPITTSDSVLRLGGNSVWGEYFAGLLDNVRIYNRALSPTEIALDRDTPVTPPAADTVAPSSPTDLTAVGGLGSVTLSWTAATDNVAVTGYDVHRATTTDFTPDPTNKVATVTGTSHLDPGLAAGTYYYRVLARDSAGNVSTPSTQVNAVATADTTAPSVSVTAPAAGATVSGSVPVSASASDAGGVAGVQLRVDGQPLGAEDTTAPYEATWNTTTVPNGTHTLTAVARDAAGNLATSAEVSVTVDNTAPPPGQPIATYNFDEGTGGTLTDRSGRGHQGTVEGATWSTAGHTGGALSFDGVDDLVTIADAADLDLTSGLTLQAWVRPTAADGWRTVLMKERPGGLSYALYSAGFNQPSGYLNIGVDQAVTGPAVLPVNTWSHLALSYDGTTMRLYVNGVEVAAQAQTGSITTSDSVLRLGGNSVWGEYFAGLIDDVRIYDRALSPAEIALDRDTPVSGGS